jgi:hypothetical protein
MPEHDHAGSDVVVMPEDGSIDLLQNGSTTSLGPGAIAVIGRKERVAVRNPASQPVTLLVVAGPTDFVAGLRRWPEPPAAR